MNKLDFFTPVRYDGQEKNIKHRIFEGIEDYFSLGGKKAYVIPSKIVDGSQEVELRHGSESKAKKVTLGAIKVVSYVTGIIPLIVLIAKAIFRGTHKFHSIPTVTLLQEGIDIKDGTVSKVRSCMKTILRSKEEGGVHLYNSQSNHRVFSLDTEPGLVFKMKVDKNVQILGHDDSMKTRYQKMISAKTVCRTHELGLLVIPNAKLFTVNADGEDYDIIAEQKVDINPDESTQEKLFEEHADSLNKAVRDLTVFIIKTKFSDVAWRNIPVLNDSQDENGNRKVALVDIEEMSSAARGLFGCSWRRGLVGCVNEEQGEIVVKEAKKHLSWSSSFGETAERSQKRRKDELEDGVKLKEFYSTHNIQNGDEQIVVGQEALDFSGFPKSEELKQLATDLINKINKRAAKSSPEKSVKERRHVHINTNHRGSPFYTKDTTRPDTKKGDYDYKTDEEYYNATYLGIVVRKLVELGHIYKLIKRNGHGYFMQA